MFRDEGLTHETSALKLFTVATTVSLEYYPLRSFVPYPIYHFVFSSQHRNESLSVSLSQAHKKKSLMRATSKLLKTSNKGTAGNLVLTTTLKT